MRSSIARKFSSIASKQSYKHLVLLPEVISLEEEKVLETFLHPVLSQENYDSMTLAFVEEKYVNLRI